MLRLLPWTFFGLQFEFSLDSLGLLLLITVPMMLLAAPLQIIITTYTKFQGGPELPELFTPIWDTGDGDGTAAVRPTSGLC